MVIGKTFPHSRYSVVCEMMVQIKRIVITTAIGILTGLYCAGSLMFLAPTGVTPESWFMVMIVYGRTLQGFVIGFADIIPLHPILRGAGLGAIFSLLLCIVPLFAHNYLGAGLLFVFGILYGVLTDWIASRVMQKHTLIPAGSKK